MSLAEAQTDVESELRKRIAKLEKINAALMVHVERVTDQPEGAYSLFQTAIMLDGRVRSRTEALTKLTDRLERSNEALVLAKDEAERANRSKTRFLAAASHDLLQPLNATRLSAATLSAMPMQPEAARVLQRVEQGLQTIEEVIKTLLDISKLDAGVVQPVIAAVPMRELLAELEAEYQDAVETKGIRLVLRCPPDLLVRSDRNLLRRILGNLVSNAVRYTHDGGVLVAARRRAGSCRVDIVDTGVGIPAGEHDLIFEEFFRGHNAGEVGSGLGLGLSIVHRLTAALAHELGFSSAIGRGSWFRVTLPVVVEEPRAANGTAAHTRTLAGTGVLIVENDGPTLEALTRLLETWGMDVIPVADPRDAVARVFEIARLDLVIVDFHVGSGLTGTDVVAAVRAATDRAVPALVVTADHSPDVQAHIENGKCALLHKPVKPAQLRSILSFLVET